MEPGVFYHQFIERKAFQYYCSRPSRFLKAEPILITVEDAIDGANGQSLSQLVFAASI